MNILANYSKIPGAVPLLRNVLLTRPILENSLLSKLAEDPRNTALILSLAMKTHKNNGLVEWQQKLLYSLVKANRLRLAEVLWRRFSDQRAHNAGDFSDSIIKSPFTWTFAESSEAAARPMGHVLDVLYFGRADVSIASKLLLLQPGKYSFLSQVSETPREAMSLSWTVTCLPSNKQILKAPISTARSTNRVVDFAVPQKCDAQQVNLVGSAQTDPVEIALKVVKLEVRSRK